MAYRKTHDLCVKAGTYMKDGEEKNRYENVGQVLEDENGGKLYLLKRTFNPAGVPNPDDKDMVLLSVFEVRDRDDAPPPSKKKAAPQDDLDDDIPF